VSRHPLLSADEERALARAYRAGDGRAGHALVTANLRFVVKVAHGYRSYGLRLVDLIQEGNIGLMKAVQKFDPDMGIRLISYAVWWIRAYIQNYILRSWSLVKLGTTQAQRKLFFSLGRARREAERSGPDADRTRHMARSLRVQTDDVRHMEERLEARDVSLDAPVGDGGASHVDFVASELPPQDEALSAAEEFRIVSLGVDGALARLDPRERYIVEQRLMADHPATLKKLGDHFGFSRERARQLEIRARDKLREALRPLAHGLGRGTGEAPEASRRGAPQEAPRRADAFCRAAT
jgi:RNA polymerase sigma-32 factor